jgi:hypothetical protein
LTSEFRRSLEDRLQQEKRVIRDLQGTLERRDKEASLLRQRSNKVGDKQKELNECTVTMRAQKEKLEKQDSTIRKLEATVKKLEEFNNSEVKLRQEEITMLKSVQATLTTEVEERKRDLAVALDVSTSVVTRHHTLLAAMIKQLGR